MHELLNVDEMRRLVQLNAIAGHISLHSGVIWPLKWKTYYIGFKMLQAELWLKLEYLSTW